MPSVSVLIGALSGRKNSMLGRSEPFVVGPPKVQFPCRESATFLNESIILEIITGRNLGPAVGHLIKKTRAGSGTHTTFPLNVATKRR